MDRDTPAPSSASPPPPAAAPARPRALRRWAVAVGLLAAAPAGLVLWAWHSPQALAWTLARVPGLQVEDLNGSLAQGTLRAAHLSLQSSAGRLDIEGLRIDGLAARWRPRPGCWVALTVPALQADTLRWHSAAAQPASPPGPPLTDLHLPLDLRVDRLSVGRLQVDTLPELQALQARLELGADQGRLHTLQLQSLRTDRFTLKAELQAQTAGPMTVQARAQAQGLGSWPWQARLRLDGPLADLAAEAHLEGRAPAGQAAPRAGLQTRLHPLADWPLGDLTLDTRALDLSALDSRAPLTRLTGQARLRMAGLHQPAELALTLRNEAPGRWDQGRLPVRALGLRAHGTPSPLTELVLDQLSVDWAGADGPAGRWLGDGRYEAGSTRAQARLTLRLDGWQPARLDPRAPPVTLQGPLALTLDGLPGHAADAPAATPALTVRSALQGQGPAGTPPLRLALDGRFAADALQVDRLELAAGASRGRLEGQARQQAGRWQWQARGQLTELDGRLWWPGTPGSAWQQLSQRLNADLDSAGSVSAAAGTLPAAWASLQGQLNLRLHPSEWAGVHLQGEARLDKNGAAPTARVALQAEDSRLDARWQAGPGPADPGQGELTLQVPRLAALAPWARWVPALADWPLERGRIQLKARLQDEAGQPRWQIDGEAAQLQAGDVQLRQLNLDANGGWAADSPLQVRLRASGLQQGLRRLSALNLSVDGSVAQHRLSLQADSPLHPPAWLERLAQSRSGQGSRLQARLEGQWRSAPDGSDWRGRLLEPQLRAADGSGEPWLSATALDAQVHWRADGRLDRATLAPGALRGPGLALRWRQASLQAAQADRPAQFDLEAELPPVALAPLLARVQPGMGWQGDLQLGGQLTLHQGRRLDLDLVLDRQGGDLSIDEDGLLATPGRLALGLSDLRLGLAAHGGVWQFTQALAGQHLGAMGGVLTARTAPDRLWPDPQAELQGSASLHVANLGAWASWLPAGWRLGGELDSALQVSGRWGAPELAGGVQGRRLSLRQPLQGMDYSGGELQLALDGRRARLTQFRLQGGDGQLSATGEALLGEAPRLDLQLQATRFRALNRLDRRLVVSGQAQLRLDRDQFALDGQLAADEGLYDFSHGDGPSLSDDVVVVGGPEAGTEAPEAGASRRSTHLALALDLGRKLRLRGRGLDTTLQGQLALANPRGQLSLKGDVRTVNGTYAAYGQKLSIERGNLLFNGPPADPRLDIQAIRPNLDAKVGVTITGTALNPRVRLYSDTDMTDTERLSWLVMGRAPDNLGQADTALLQRAALALLAGEGESPTDTLLRQLGLSDFSLRQGTEGTVQSTVVGVGKQLSQRWYVGYERGVNATTGSWQVIYRVAQRFTLRGQTGEDNALDAIWTWRWD